MVVVFANNQTLVALGTTAVTVFTDPVPLGNNDRLGCILDIHHIQAQGGAPQLLYLAQVSNDGGQNFIDTAVTDTETAAGVSNVTGEAVGALVRLKYVFSNPGA